MNVFASRLPIFDLGNRTCGYELLYRVNSQIVDDEVKQNTEKQIVRAMKSYLYDNMGVIFKERLAFINFSELLLKNDIPLLFKPEKLIIEITPTQLRDEITVRKCLALKAKGYLLALCDYFYADTSQELFKVADIIKFDINGDVDKITDTVARCKESSKEIFAQHIDSNDKLEFARDLRCNYLQGFFFTIPALTAKKTGHPMVRTFLQVLALLYAPEPDIEQVATVISTDPVLTIRLLKLINQMCASTGNTISTVKQALILLGFDNLKEWVYIVGLQRLNRNAPNELLRHALFRAVFCEHISRITPGVGQRSKEMYLMGLLSIITGSTPEELSEALDGLPVSDEIKQGLMLQGGVYSDVYKIVYNYERGNFDEVDASLLSSHIETQSLAAQYVNTLNYIDRNVRL